MVFPIQLRLSLGLITLLFAQRVQCACGGDKPISLCCMGLAPFSTNAAVWGGICGYSPSSQNELIGGRCITISGSCPSGSIATCCAGTFPGPSGQCGLGTNCGTPSSTTLPPPPPVVPPVLPLGWTTDFACSIDSAPRVLANAIVTRPSANTPANCINQCASQGYIYAGVENGNECICGTGYNTSPAPSTINSANCSTRCSGNNANTCGGAWAIQLYHGPTPVDVFPVGWTQTDACAIDVPSRVLTDVITTQMTDNTPGKCAFHCSGLGYAYAGVEYGNECHCGTGIVPDTGVASTAECNMPCAGNKGLTCGAGWRIQIYSNQT